MRFWQLKVNCNKLRYNRFMLSALFAIFVVGILLIVSEYLWRQKILKGEYGRKLLHLSLGLFIASWPYFLEVEAIKIISIAAFVTLLISRKFKIFHAIYDVSRLTYGDLFYPLSIFLIALFAKADWIFAVSVLFVALADGMAAFVGKKWGTKKYTYYVVKSKKTVIGTLAYIVFAYVSLFIGLLIGGSHVLTSNPFIVFVWLPVASSILEAVSPYGTDNITAPLLVLAVLNLLWMQ